MKTSTTFQIKKVKKVKKWVVTIMLTIAFFIFHSVSIKIFQKIAKKRGRKWDFSLSRNVKRFLTRKRDKNVVTEYHKKLCWNLFGLWRDFFMLKDGDKFQKCPKMGKCEKSTSENWFFMSINNCSLCVSLFITLFGLYFSNKIH